MDILIIAIVWFILSAAVGTYADRLGRLGVVYFLMSLIFSPLLMFIVALANGPKLVYPTFKTHKHCPNCAEWVLHEAIVCKHCGRDLPVLKTAVQPHSVAAELSRGQNHQLDIRA